MRSECGAESSLDSSLERLLCIIVVRLHRLFFRWCSWVGEAAVLKIGGQGSCLAALLSCWFISSGMRSRSGCGAVRNTSQSEKESRIHPSTRPWSVCCGCMARVDWQWLLFRKYSWVDDGENSKIGGQGSSLPAFLCFCLLAPGMRSGSGCRAMRNTAQSEKKNLVPLDLSFQSFVVVVWRVWTGNGYVYENFPGSMKTKLEDRRTGYLSSGSSPSWLRQPGDAFGISISRHANHKPFRKPGSESPRLDLLLYGENWQWLLFRNHFWFGKKELEDRRTGLLSSDSSSFLFPILG